MRITALPNEQHRHELAGWCHEPTRDGVPLPPKIWGEIVEAAERLGVTVPEPLAAA